MSQSSIFIYSLAIFHLYVQSVYTFFGLVAFELLKVLSDSDEKNTIQDMNVINALDNLFGNTTLKLNI